ncbi:MAG TPA: nuclear transport factor 2 family protein [Candidatus Angelobacter sp.]|nr:nuclear transport factor 2 family protein [Candidatus Angelobacter sp.]
MLENRIGPARCLLVLLTALVVSAQEPVKPALTPRIITATRQVSIFTDLERQLLTAIQKKDKQALQGLVTDDYVLEMPNADPLAGEDWTDSVLSKDFALKSFQVRQMSVADLGQTAVVKFDRLQRATYKGKDDSGEFFVVDLWKKNGDAWKLANRYVSKVSSVVPAQKAVKPTGKN